MEEAGSGFIYVLNEIDNIIRKFTECFCRKGDKYYFKSNKSKNNIRRQIMSKIDPKTNKISAK
ncbi:MAG: hypothetical protein DHS20C18_02360 [Saprospiraceae bacterium]|nr:MAG: hypothetical protein DHS20C18_02360 [Saprospiraceae bacterium]